MTLLLNAADNALAPFTEASTVAEKQILRCVNGVVGSPHRAALEDSSCGGFKKNNDDDPTETTCDESFSSDELFMSLAGGDDYARRLSSSDTFSKLEEITKTGLRPKKTEQEPPNTQNSAPQEKEGGEEECGDIDDMVLSALSERSQEFPQMECENCFPPQQH